MLVVEFRMTNNFWAHNLLFWTFVLLVSVLKSTPNHMPLKYIRPFKISDHIRSAHHKLSYTPSKGNSLLTWQWLQYTWNLVWPTLSIIDHIKESKLIWLPIIIEYLYMRGEWLDANLRMNTIKYLFNKNSTARCLKSINHFRFSIQHSWGCLCDLLKAHN